MNKNNSKNYEYNVPQRKLYKNVMYSTDLKILKIQASGHKFIYMNNGQQPQVTII